MAFWTYFAAEAEPRLHVRATTFRAIFEHLDTLAHPLTIVETGCARREGAWSDGQSTVLFDRYVTARGDGSHCHSIDLSAESVAACRAMVGPGVTVHQGDSVRTLHRLCRDGTLRGPVDLLYLDSFDLDVVYWFPAAAHHLKEFIAAAPRIGPATLVAVDDSPTDTLLVRAGEQNWTALYPPRIGGKGSLIAEYAAAVGAREVFSSYQVAWTGF